MRMLARKMKTHQKRWPRRSNRYTVGMKKNVANGFRALGNTRCDCGGPRDEVALVDHEHPAVHVEHKSEDSTGEGLVAGEDEGDEADIDGGGHDAHIRVHSEQVLAQGKTGGNTKCRDR